MAGVATRLVDPGVITPPVGEGEVVQCSRCLIPLYGPYLERHACSSEYQLQRIAEAIEKLSRPMVYIDRDGHVTPLNGLGEKP